MKKKKKNGWDEIDGGKALAVPMSLIRSPNFRRLSPFSNKLLFDLGSQYTGFNNGYLCAAWSIMKPLGWKSPVTLSKALLELEHYGIILKSRQGGRNQANLYAFTWRRVDEKKLQAPLLCAPGAAPSNDWKSERPDFEFSSGRRKVRKNDKLQEVASAELAQKPLSRDRKNFGKNAPNLPREIQAA